MFWALGLITRQHSGREDDILTGCALKGQPAPKQVRPLLEILRILDLTVEPLKNELVVSKFWSLFPYHPFWGGGGGGGRKEKKT